MKSPKHVFISFKSFESETASLISDKLKATGYRVWFSEDLQCGNEWHGEIDKAITEAGAIVVLWSEESMKSVWVKHEASQAIAKNIYAPVRISPIVIESPYNRIQTADIIDWNGDVKEPGFRHLLERLEKLMPNMSLDTALRNWLWKNRTSIISLMLAAAAIWLLYTQRVAMGSQVKQQSTTFDTIREQSKLMHAQLNQQSSVLKNLESQRGILEKQILQQEQIFDNTQQQSKSLDEQVLKQKNILFELYRNNNLFDDFKMKLKIRYNMNQLGVYDKNGDLLKSTADIFDYAGITASKDSTFYSYEDANIGLRDKNAKLWLSGDEITAITIEKPNFENDSGYESFVPPPPNIKINFYKKKSTLGNATASFDMSSPDLVMETATDDHNHPKIFCEAIHIDSAGTVTELFTVFLNKSQDNNEIRSATDLNDALLVFDGFKPEVEAYEYVQLNYGFSYSKAINIDAARIERNSYEFPAAKAQESAYPGVRNVNNRR